MRHLSCQHHLRCILQTAGP